MFWNFLRNKARAAIIAGVGDAIAELEQSDGMDMTESAQRLLARVSAALPSPQPKVDEHARKGRKGN